MNRAYGRWTGSIRVCAFVYIQKSMNVCVWKVRRAALLAFNSRAHVLVCQLQCMNLIRLYNYTSMRPLHKRETLSISNMDSPERFAACVHRACRALLIANRIKSKSKRAESSALTTPYLHYISERFSFT